MTDFAEALTYLVSDDPAANVTRIKDVITDNIRATDSRVRIGRTDHFNHSYVPDFVLSWGGADDERRVFLRTSFDLAALREDLDELGSDRPILLSLERVDGEDRDKNAFSALGSQSRGDRTLIADPYGFEALTAQVADQPVVSLFSHAVLQGGKGIISAETASAAGESIGVGFAAARQAEANGTGRAVETAEVLLDQERAGAMNRLLHAVWIGSGASGTTFPGASGVTSLLEGETLRFLLDLPPIEDPDFWSRVGRDMTLARVCGAGDALETPNLQFLLAACAGRLEAKACRVIGSDQPPRTAWSIRGDSLQLDLGPRRVLFVPRAISEFVDSEPVAGQPSLQTLRDRARNADVTVTEVRLSSDTRRAAYGSEDEGSITEGEELLGLRESFGDDFSVTAATARLTPDSSRSVDCNFATGTAMGKTNSRYTLAELTVAAVPLLAEGLLPSEATTLREVFQGHAPAQPEAE